MVVTTDTSVLFQAFHSRRGASYQILQMVRFGEITMAVSLPVFQEYRDLFSREAVQEQLELQPGDSEVLLQFIATIARPTSIHYAWRPNLRDENDDMIMELALASGSQYLITRNTRDFVVDTDLSNEEVTVVTPGEFIRMWRGTHGT
ncbi:MAG: putative toxin-antitoxin system toxin component, PIN family [Spirochaetaceae bacterium]